MPFRGVSAALRPPTMGEMMLRSLPDASSVCKNHKAVLFASVLHAFESWSS